MAFIRGPMVPPVELEEPTDQPPMFKKFNISAQPLLSWLQENRGHLLTTNTEHSRTEEKGPGEAKETTSKEKKENKKRGEGEKTS